MLRYIKKHNFFIRGTKKEIKTINMKMWGNIEFHL